MLATTPSTRAVIGRLVEVTADLHQVKVRAQGRVVGCHDRVWARGMTVADPAHLATAKLLREQFRQPRPHPAAIEEQQLVRDLADYDRAFGLSGDLASDGQVA